MSTEPRLILEQPCEHGYMAVHYTCDHIGYPEYNQMEHRTELCHCSGGVRTVFDRTRLIETLANAIASHDMQSGPFNMLVEIGEDMADAYRAYAAKHIDALLSELDD
jgi:hypothetical protein